MQKGKVIIVYHRQPYKEVVSNGRLTFCHNEKPNGIIPLLVNFFIAKSGVWIAASEFSALPTVAESEEIRLTEVNASCILRRVHVTKEELNSFYHKTSKEGFWPILHSFPEKYNFNSVDWEIFVDINKRFAESVCKEMKSEDIVWVHDYNLWLVPYFVRKIRPDARIAFFFHTPFPNADIFNILHWRKQILESLMCCDLLSFDIPRYVENFVAAVRSNFLIDRISKKKVKKSFRAVDSALSEPFISTEIIVNQHKVKLDAIPEGTNYKLIRKIQRTPACIDKLKEIRQSTLGCRIIFSASRTDYIKGTIELLQCYERLFERNPTLISKIVLRLVTVEPATGMTTYNNIQSDLRILVDRINKKFSTPIWKPVDYSTQNILFQDLVPWFTATDILWITSLRDGMNIVCKEFIACKKKSDGVLILSEFAGASVELEGAILTNPYSPPDMDEAIDKALSIPLSEKKNRMEKLFRKMLSSDISVWSKQLKRLEKIQTGGIKSVV